MEMGRGGFMFLYKYHYGGYSTLLNESCENFFISFSRAIRAYLFGFVLYKYLEEEVLCAKIFFFSLRSSSTSQCAVRK